MDSLSREQRRLCSLLAWEPASPGLVEGFGENDWAAVLDLAKTQRLLPLVFVRLKAAGLSERLPSHLQASLQDLYYNSLLLHTRRFHKFTEALRALAESGVPAIPLKGAYLASVVFGNLGVRSSVDYDILVRRGDHAKAVRLVEGLGYVPSKPYSLDWRLATYRHLPSYTKGEHHALQIHWNIVDPESPFRVEPQGLWDRAQAAPFDGMEIPTLSPEDLLLHLSIHGAYMHQFHEGLRSLCDVSETVRHFKDVMDWERLVSLASQWGATKCAYLVLLLAERLLETEIPEKARQSLLPGDPEPQVVDRAMRMLFAPESGFISEAPGFSWRRVARSPKGAVEQLLKAAFPPRYIVAREHGIPPNRPQVLLYYPVRWLKMAERYASRLLGLNRKKRKTSHLTGQSQRDRSILDWMRPD